MRKLNLLGMLVILLAATSLFSQTSTWGEDYEAALKEANKDGKYLLLNFGGSDWCVWCKRLDGEVFSQDAFNTWAKDNLVLLMVDSPRAKKQDDKVVQQNNVLKRKYAIRGFPTIILLNPEGELAAQTGYQQGGPEKYVEHLKELIAKDQKS
ncbi:thioredoxin family protein [candidate division KSB1 bacterium]|nr:thioredoxin family protein [candidate division KSB1 bacterium]